MPLLKSKDFHYGVTDREKFSQIVDLLGEALSFTDNGWCADNLITFGKSIGFLGDEKFMRAVYAAKPSEHEIALLWRTHTLAWAAQHCLSLEGDFVEAGVYRGTTARILCNYLEFAKLDRTYWLYDLWASNPHQKRQFDDMGDDLYQKVIERFADVGNARVVRGSLPDSLRQGMPERVALLHIDMNSPEGEIGCLEALWDRVTPGGLIILDDYGWVSFKAQREVERPWFAARNKAVLDLPTGQGLVIR